MQYAHNENWLLTGEDDGKLKYWKPNLECVKVLGHHIAACFKAACCSQTLYLQVLVRLYFSMVAPVVVL